MKTLLKQIGKGTLWTWGVALWLLGINWAFRLLAATDDLSVVVGVTVLGVLGTLGWIVTRIPRAALVSWCKEHIDL